MQKFKYVCLLLLLLMWTTTQAQEKQTTPQFQTTKLSEKQYYRVTFTSKLDPITINTMHAWIIHIENKIDEAVLDAEVTVVGGMPEHNHGLPTRPQVTQNLGDGNYLLEGIKFHMGGWWQVSFSIREKKISDNVTFDLQLQH